MTVSAPFVAPLEVLAERGSKKANVEKWDGTLMKLLALSGFSIYLIAGLDHRWRWSTALSFEWHASAIVFFILGFALMVWSLSVNRFFSTAVRIQNDRNHQVCSKGPYRYIRHPGYLGMMVYYSATPIFLGSMWALIPSAATAILFVIRTSLEDQALKSKLPGYSDYAKKTKYRLIPGLW